MPRSYYLLLFTMFRHVIQVETPRFYMARQDLRIFDHSGDEPGEEDLRRHGREVRLGAVFPLLADALVHERSWLHDFADEKIVLSRDLYEILATYQRLQRRRAG